MEEIVKFQNSTTALDQLRCSICKGYLSHAPLRLLPNGNSICGRCSPSPGDRPCYRQLAFEAFLGNILFPCQFKYLGCSERLPFGEVAEHEEKCIYQRLSCPVLPSDACSWKGPWLQATDHIIEKHSNFVKKKAEFQFQANQDKEEVAMVMIADVGFMIKLAYVSNKKQLLYHMQYLPSIRNIQDESYKVWLMNASDRDFSSTINGGSCVSFNTHFYDMVHSHTLTISDYLKILNKPESIIVTMGVKIDLTVDFKLLELLKCKSCNGYLVPPIFYCEEGVICYDCFDYFKGCKSSANDDLQERIAKTNYPCCWEDCDFVDKGSNIRKHELNCKHYVYQCPTLHVKDFKFYVKCGTFKTEQIITHFKSSDKHHFAGDGFTYKTSLAENKAKTGRFTVKFGRLVLILFSNSLNTHTININVSEAVAPPNRRKMHLHPIKCRVHFEHDHCQTKSNVFIISKSRSFTVNDFPDCFKDNKQLTVTLKLFEEIISI